MDRDAAVRMLLGGIDGIREWNRRRDQQETTPSLEGVDMQAARLSFWSTFEGWVPANLSKVNLRRAKLSDAILFGCNLSEALLEGAELRHADLRTATLRDANAAEADLFDSDLSGAIINGADLRGANLFGVNLSGTICIGTNLAGSQFGRNNIAANLRGTAGLDLAVHLAPSQVSVGTLLSFKDTLPEVFLRGCGLADEDIAYFRSRIAAPIQFYSCFISYTDADSEFAEKLYADFEAAGIRCWKWNHEARTGRDLWAEIDQAIRVHDKLVLIASASSLTSPAIIREIERAITQEDERQQKIQRGESKGTKDVLFPVRIDDFVFEQWEHARKVDVTKKVIADARGWESDPKKYIQVRDKLIRDLKAIDQD